MFAILTVGISASGKSTWAKKKEKQGFQVFSRDDYRWALMVEKGISPSWRNWKWKWEDEVTRRVNNDLEIAASEKADVIIADTNLSDRTRQTMANFLKSLGYEIDVRVFDEVDYDEALARDNERAHGVGHSVLQKQWQALLDLKGRPLNDGPVDAVIVDIDGTMALMNGRSPFDWDRVDEDLPHDPVIQMVRGLARSNRIIFTSGRDEVCRAKTEKWLVDEFESGEGWDEDWVLFMRKEGDQRKDTIVKREIFDREIQGKYKVVAVVDDRPSVCRMWRDLGLNVIQVGNPYIEF